MKHTKRILGFGLGLALLGGVFAGMGGKQEIEAEAAGPGYDTYCPVSLGWIENTDGSAETTLASATRSRNDRFWNGGTGWDEQERTFNAMDEFVDTIHRANGGEGWRGAYRTPELELHDNNHRYVSFLFGGGSGDIFVNIFQVNGEAGAGDRISGIHTHFDSVENVDAHLRAPMSCNMTFYYYELPNEIQPGDHFLIYVRDGKTGDYGGFTFGNVHYNQTLEDVAKTFSAHKTQVKLNEYTSEWNRVANEYVLNFYATDSYYAAVRTAEAALNNANDDFEVNHHMSMWAYDYVNSTALVNYNGIISSTDVKEDGYFQVGMPSNKTGDMYVRAEDSGIGEDQKYRFVSSEFELSGSGFVSAKLGGGTAVLEVLDEDYEVIATSAIAEATGENKLRPGFKGEANQAETYNLAESGVRLNTMSRVYLDVSAHLGEKVRVAISDGRTGNGWGLAYFDEVTTYYATTPTFKVDVCRQADHYVVVPDEYVGSDSTAFGKAHAFWRSYLSLLREGSTDYCSSRVSDGVKSLLASYKDLGEAAQRLVCEAQDYQREGEAANWYDNEPVVRNSSHKYSISYSLSYLAAENGVTGVVVYGNSIGYQPYEIAQNNDTTTVLIVAVLVVTSLTLTALLLIKKRKYHNN